MTVHFALVGSLDDLDEAIAKVPHICYLDELANQGFHRGERFV